MDIAGMMDVLLAALVVELRTDGTEDVCAAALYPGDSVPLDYADCGGMAWVRLVDAGPTISFPNTDVTADSCHWSLAFQVEMGVMRPSPIPENVMNSAELPDDAENTAAAKRQLQDMMAMHRALLTARDDIDLMAPGRYTPVGPVGGTVGGTWAVTVGAD